MYVWTCVKWIAFVRPQELTLNNPEKMRSCY